MNTHSRFVIFHLKNVFDLHRSIGNPNRVGCGLNEETNMNN